eukprot:Nitzschia sp. Nitz4//scaffold12_size214221//72294//72803//NITZ4_001493-RA/size214221-snap-gene-0.115-mRNA-1//-1//CDS//3329534999//568//frame0
MTAWATKHEHYSTSTPRLLRTHGHAPAPILSSTTSSSVAPAIPTVGVSATEGPGGTTAAPGVEGSLLSVEIGGNNPEERGQIGGLTVLVNRGEIGFGRWWGLIQKIPKSRSKFPQT